MLFFLLDFVILGIPIAINHILQLLPVETIDIVSIFSLLYGRQNTFNKIKAMSFIKVRNKKGTASNNPPYGYSSWLDFWEKIKGKNTTACEVLSCEGNPDLGGHVIKHGKGGKEYILPMCFSCNNKSVDEVFEAWENDVVPVH